jgi:hypothetical protein
MILPVITLWVANINLQQSSLAQQLRQLGDVGGDPPRLVFGEQLGRRF